MIEYLKMGEDGGRKTYFKKENDKLTKIKYREYKLATKPEKIKKTKQSKSKKNPEIDDTIDYSADEAISDASTEATNNDEENDKSTKGPKKINNKSAKNPEKNDDSNSTDEGAIKKNTTKPSKFFSGASKSPQKQKRKIKVKTRKQKTEIPDNLEPQPSIEKVTAVLADLVTRKDRIAEILGSSFTDESLGIKPGHNAINPSFPLSTISSNTNSNTIPYVGGDIKIYHESNDDQHAEETDVNDNDNNESEKDIIVDGGDNTRPFNMHVFSRTIDYNSNVKRFLVPDEYVSWDKEFVDYLPTEYTESLTQLPVDHDPADFTKIDHTEFTDETTRPYRHGSLVHYSFDHSGRPLNPYGRTGLRGKGSLRFWGPNWYVFPLFVRRHKKENNHAVIELMVLNEDTKFYCAMPSCAAKDYSTIAVSRQLDNSLKMCNINEELLINDNRLINNVQLYIDSKKNTDNAWVMACAYVYNVGGTVIDSSCVSWIPLDSFDAIKNDMDEEHYQIILELIGEGGIDIDPVEPEKIKTPEIPKVDFIEKQKEPEVNAGTSESARTIGGNNPRDKSQFVKLVGKTERN
jgi:hypothetical protein